LAKFGCSRRSDRNTAEITRLLTDVGLALNPPIIRFGDSWEITTEDWIYLSRRTAERPPPSRPSYPPPKSWNADRWFDNLAGTKLRNEKEVENKFILPLLHRLGYTDDDRYDGMPVPAAHGSKNTTLVIDFALFNATMESLRNQPLLTVEAKHESLLVKQKELLGAHNQAKSYCLWTQCDFFLVTDGRLIQVYRVGKGGFGELAPIFSCARHELAVRFAELYGLISKAALTPHYLAKLSSTEEAS
jgi:hypothetical protein